ncbi:MAG: CPBP family intramembrane metalloprotease [Bacteroidales bacterium]|nr:CPBP family intramembrane metalloprotease [Bacteroidales bacterium]
MRIPFIAGTVLLTLFWFVSAAFFGFIGSFANEYVASIIIQIGIWLIPGLVYAYFFYDNSLNDLNVKNFGKRSDYGLFILLYIVSFPFLAYLIKINEAMIFPESMATLEQMFREMEDKAKEITLRMLSGTSLMDLMSALFAMAVLPAICEEVFFRGVVLNNLMKRTSRLHLSVWLSAILFSFVHFQFFGFLPRVVLGAFLGYAFVLSKSLWLPIVLHFLNNAMAIIAYYFYQKQWISEDPQAWETETITLWMAVLSLTASVCSLWFIFRRNKVRSNSE